MVPGREKWTRINEAVKVEAPRKTYRFKSMFVSPGGLFVPCDDELDPYTKVIISFSLDSQAVVAHAEFRRQLSSSGATDRGIDQATAGWEMRIVRMEGDGSQVLAEHIKKMLLSSGGPA